MSAHKGSLRAQLAAAKVGDVIWTAQKDYWMSATAARAGRKVSAERCYAIATVSGEVTRITKVTVEE